MQKNGDEAQRALEQKALQNVRTLVDKIEATDQAERSLQKKILIGFAVAAAIVLVLLVTGVIDLKRGKPAAEVVVPPAKTPSK